MSNIYELAKQMQFNELCDFVEFVKLHKFVQFIEFCDFVWFVQPRNLTSYKWIMHFNYLFIYLFPYENIEDWMHVIKGGMRHSKMVSMWFYVIQPNKIKVYIFHFKFNVII